MTTQTIGADYNPTNNYGAMGSAEKQLVKDPPVLRCQFGTSKHIKTIETGTDRYGRDYTLTTKNHCKHSNGAKGKGAPWDVGCADGVSGDCLG